MSSQLPQRINLSEKLAKFTDHWNPRIVAELNGQHVRLAKVKGDFPWHQHPDEDEFFMVLSGELTLRFRGGDVTLQPGECLVVPRGVEHQPAAEEETHLMLFEPAGTVNTGDTESDKTVTKMERI